MYRIRWRLAVPLLCSMSCALADAPALAELSLEELAHLDVATVSRKAQKLSDTPAAVTVLSAEDIRRSGARSVPEALRDVPGVQVAQIGGGRWSVGVRGWGGRFSNKLLVLLDGRTLYSPLFSGVFWEALDVMLEDVERIEVVRGPGASLWGANAVNGVINIVTRKATATPGSTVAVAVDDKGKPSVAASQGVALEGVGALRVFAKGSELAAFRSENGRERLDANYGGVAGFRMDGAGAGEGAWTLQGQTYRHRSSENLFTSTVLGFGGLIPLSLEFEGSSLAGRYSWGLTGGEASIQAFADSQRVGISDLGWGSVNTLDVDFQHRLPVSGAHEWMWGLGGRYVASEITSNASILSVIPERQYQHTFSAFAQDEIVVVPQALKLTLGARLEYSRMSHFEPQPTARLMWTPTAVDSLWANWSRAARTPSVGEADATILFQVMEAPPGAPFPGIALVSMPGTDWSRRAERLDAVELGYRRNLGNGSLEAVLFHHDYSRVIGEYLDPAGLSARSVPIPVFPYFAPIQYLHRGNVLNARSTGAEMGADIPVTGFLRLQASYTLVDTSAGRGSDTVTNGFARALETGAPHYWASLHALIKAGARQDVDIMVRRVGAITQGSVPAYNTVDLRYAWKRDRHFEFSAVIQNLFDPLHLEYVSNFLPGQPAYAPRRAYVQGVWRF